MASHERDPQPEATKPTHPQRPARAPTSPPAASAPPQSTERHETTLTEGQRVIPLHEERLAAQKQPRELGEVLIHKRVEAVPAHLDVDVCREEVAVEHVPVGQVVPERKEPWQEDGV